MRLKPFFDDNLIGLFEQVSANGLLMLLQLNSRQQGVLKVKNMRWIAAFFACLLIAFFANISTSMAQTKVGIVDIGKIFKSHPEFSQQLGVLKQEADTFQKSAVAAQQQLVQKAEVLKQYKPGSVEFKKAETGLAQQSAAMEVEQRDKMRALMVKEAQLHFDTYAEVNQIVGQLCEAQGIQLVLRYNSQEMDLKNPASVMQRVNGSVIYHNPGNDITDLIIGRISQMKGTASNTGQPRR